MKKIFCICILLLLTGCFEKPIPENVIALVNDKPILLSTVRSLQDIDLVDINDNGKPSLTKIRKQYGATLSKVILYEMILQEVEKHGNKVTSEQVDAYEQSLRNAYPPDEFEKFVTENAIDIEAWRILLRYQLAMDTFKSTVLLKRYEPDIDEVKQFYAEHKNSFNLPKSYNLQVVLSEEKSKLVNITSLDALKQNTELEQYNINMQEQALEKPWLEAIVKLNEQECTDILEQENNFSRICLVKQNSSRNLSITQAYVYIEKQLAEAHVSELLDMWIEQNIQNFPIKVSSHLIKDLP